MTIAWKNESKLSNDDEPYIGVRDRGGLVGPDSTRNSVFVLDLNRLAENRNLSPSPVWDARWSVPSIIYQIVRRRTLRGFYNLPLTSRSFFRCLARVRKRAIIVVETTLTFKNVERARFFPMPRCIYRVVHPQGRCAAICIICRYEGPLCSSHESLRGTVRLRLIGYLCDDTRVQ